MYKKQLLIVEDDPDIRQLLSDVFGREYAVLLAGNGDEGLRLALSVRPDAAIVDLMMPVPGLEMIRGLNANSSTRKIPVIIMTARDLDMGMQGFLKQEANVQDYFRKGADLGSLQMKVSMLFVRQPALVKAVMA